MRGTPRIVGGGSGGGGGYPTIGNPVIGGTPNRILFIDPAGNLSQDDNLTFDNSTKNSRIGGTDSFWLNDTSLGLSRFYVKNGWSVYDSTYNTFDYLSINPVTDVVNAGQLRTYTTPTPTFSGTGLDDIIIFFKTGTFTGPIGTSFTVTITSVNNQNVSYTALSGGSFNIGDTISNGSGVTGTVTLDYGSGFYLTDVTGGQFAPSDPLDNGLGVTATAQGVSVLYDLYDWTDTDGGSGSGATDGEHPYHLEFL